MQTPKARASVILTGNPNCGKTTLFNCLTGSNYKVANYPGVTVEKKEGAFQISDTEQATLIDVPGLYSLSGNSLDEKLATKALLGEVPGEGMPDLIVVVVDASNLERNLYVVTQLIDTGLPLIVALNMIDMAERRGISVKSEILSRELGDIPVVSIVASKNTGITNLRNSIATYLKNRPKSSKQLHWIPPGSPYADVARELGKFALKKKQRTSAVDEFIIGSALLSEVVSSADAAVNEETTKLIHNLSTDYSVDCASFEATNRYKWINEIVRKCCSVVNPSRKLVSDRIDYYLTHRFWGTLIFIALMTLIFQTIFSWAQMPMESIDFLVSKIRSEVTERMPVSSMRSLLADGIIPGVGSVLMFIPQIGLLFFFLSLLEDSGYLARAAFLMDKIMRQFGLQGRSFIPLLSSFACAIPGIMSTRTIPSLSDRMATIMIAPLMSCSARLPVYTLLIAAFVPQKYYFGFISLQGLVLLGMYLLGIIGAAIVAWLLRMSVLRGIPALFVMEMPQFRAPSLKLAIREVYDRALIFCKNAGTIIMACSIVLWFLASYPKGNIENSYAGRLGKAIEPAIAPLGFNWEIGVGVIASFAAREVFVTSLSTVYNLEETSDMSQSLIQVLKAKREEGKFSSATAFSLMVFYVFACQCMSTLAVCRRETGSWAWTAFMFLYMTGLAYFASFVTYRIAVIFA